MQNPFAELCEGGGTLKMECSCRGELVQNLPATILCIQTTRMPRTTAIVQVEDHSLLWQEFPILIVIIILQYFLFPGVAMSASAVISELLRWQRRWYAHSLQQSNIARAGEGNHAMTNKPETSVGS
ncbi:hypothetical protein MLD38_011635 [Melastoma candidum]|uniref:Uncharacterized protein n=1 Tax=Melastoma candidum TaxID=119954 RepID=A0ACB9R336_9MYRT|nr:hypothetical protein MLD38_011635 [Melastoma candidum]